MGIILALESSAKAASAALTDGRKTLLAQYFQNTGLTHSRTLLVVVEDILRNNDLTIADINKIAVAHGPGSFTGIRIGIAAAQGLAWGADKPVAGVSTLLAAASVFEYTDFIICPVMDARRGEIYNALFRHGGEKITRLCGDRALSVDALIEGAIINADAPYLLCGDGAEMCYERFIAAGVDARLAPEMTRLQCAYGVALAAADMEGGAGIEPNYLRVPQAERLLAAGNPG